MKKNMFLSIIMLCLIMVSLLAACSPGPTTSTTTASQPTAAVAATTPATVAPALTEPTSTAAVPVTASQDTPTAAAAAAGAGQTSTQAARVNLNTASENDFLAVPNVGARMVREFMEYRPYTSILQFEKEIGKYVSADQVAAYKQYVYVPISVNNADAATLMQIPGLEQAEAEQLVAARPFASADTFLSQLSQYVSADELSAARAYLAE